MVEIFTSRINYPYSPERLDITVKSGDKVFAPTWDIVIKFKRGEINWEEYTTQYISQMRKSYENNRRRWLEVLSMPRLVLVCYCTNPKLCHRTILGRDLLPAVAKVNDTEAKFVGELKFKESR
jgi:uncharacterized protein YeaO (DUF488 family)